MNRIRFAMAPDANAPKRTGIVECDETYIGPRRPRHKGTSRRGRGTSKTPVSWPWNGMDSFAVASSQT